MSTVTAKTRPASADATPASAPRAAKMLGSAILLAAAVGLAVAFAPQPGYAQAAKTTASASKKNVSKWIGKTTKEVKARLGDPSSSQYLQETGGWLLIYSHPGEHHYVFETGPDGRVRKATTTN